MPFYKFMKRDVRDRVEAGSIRLGRLGYYRLLEAVTKDCWIGDRFEATAVDELKGVSFTPSSDSHDRTRLREIGIDVEGAAHFTAESIEHLIRTDGFVFSFSNGSLADLTIGMSNPNLGAFAYDGCLELLDPNLLKQRIQDASIEGGIISNLYRVEIGPVRYGDVRTVNAASTPAASFFLKRQIFSRQQEWRIALVPHDTTIEISAHDFLALKIDPTGLFGAIDLPKSSSNDVALGPANVRRAFDRLLQFADQSRPDNTEISVAEAVAEYWVLREQGTLKNDKVDNMIISDFPEFFLKNRLLFDAKIAIERDRWLRNN